MFYLEYCLELNEELEENCDYKYYVLHDANLRKERKHWFDDDRVYYQGTLKVVVLKVFKIN